MAQEKVKLPTYETLLTEAIRSLAVDSGLVASPVSAGGNALTDSTKNWATNVHKNRLVKIVRGSGVGQLAVIDGNSANTLLIRGSWPQGIGAGAVYVILDKDLAQILRDVFGGGSDISAANPLETHDPEVATIEAKLDHASHGLAALKTLLDAVETKLDTPANFMADVSALALEATLGAHDTDIKALLATIAGYIDPEIATIEANTSYTEDSVDGTTTDTYADALDVDTRGMKSFSAVVKNTDGANSLKWRLRARPSNYSAGADEEIPECPGEETLVAGEKGLAELLKSYSRIKIQVVDAVGGSHATYTIDYLINR